MLSIDYANCLSERVGNHGLDAAWIGPGSELADAARTLTASLAKTRGTGWERWRDLPFGDVRRQHVSEVKKLASERRNAFENLVVLGIGGSALGNIALQAALNPPTWNLLPSHQRGGPRMFVIDNVDPANFAAIMEICPPEQTLYNVVSKSGETAETAAQFMWVRDVIHRALGTTAAMHVVAITDPEKGTMRKICDAEGYVTLPVPEGVGGRFSVLSPVGLFSAAMCGIDIDALLDGAAAMDKRCSDPDLSKNPAAMIAGLLCELGAYKGKTCHVLMPYANSLYLLADWFRQLWAESLGKQFDRTGDQVFAGFTPIKALGATDQHSQIQLYREGPNDKVIGLIEVEDFGSNVTIPKGLGVDALRYLEGRSMGALLNAEKRATEFALVESQRPNFTIRMPRIDAYTVGEFISLWQIATSYAGLMLGIDAYDQPAVETGKKATFGLMGREGYGEWKQKVDEALAPTGYTV
ncbi:MAG: glucose-6-phosphate isomerase [Leptolyngbya sp. PLA3]|nr:MAG: glucose-6-phosphate isomerase [Cyanobacteria bacterium CYA]MCE7968140.1 glucose-6-phosphate isomerase [Leptolyngbya sp. PL-A3]